MMGRYFNVMGIEYGDIVTTNYSTGPYFVVHASSPRYVTFLGGCMFAYEHPVFSLTLKSTPENPVKGSGEFYLNWFSRIDGEYRNIGRDRLYVQKATNRKPLQMDMFSSQILDCDPHMFLDSVDYETRDLWHCQKCVVDFNGRSDKPGVSCPVCHSARDVKKLFRMAFK